MTVDYAADSGLYVGSVGGEAAPEGMAEGSCVIDLSIG